jgi:hypothetical protein
MNTEDKKVLRNWGKMDSKEDLIKEEESKFVELKECSDEEESKREISPRSMIEEVIADKKISEAEEKKTLRRGGEVENEWLSMRVFYLIHVSLNKREVKVIQNLRLQNTVLTLRFISLFFFSLFGMVTGIQFQDSFEGINGANLFLSSALGVFTQILSLFPIEQRNSIKLYLLILKTIDYLFLYTTLFILIIPLYHTKYHIPIQILILDYFIFDLTLSLRIIKMLLQFSILLPMLLIEGIFRIISFKWRNPFRNFREIMKHLSVETLLSEINYITFKKEANLMKCCIICFQEFTNLQKVCQLSCHKSHIFHKECILKWYKKQRVCPYCRKIAHIV